MDDNALDFEVAKSAGEYFRLNDEQMDTIIHKVLEVIGQWQTLAAEIGISCSEQVLITGAFMDG
jgi:serine/threonine-protein kinase HipA